LFLNFDDRLRFGKKEEATEKEMASIYNLKADVFPSLFIILLGSIDCVTTVIGVLYFGAAELNPFLTGIVNTSIVAFLVLKLTATFLIGITYILAKRTLNKTTDKESRIFKYSNRIMNIAYAGLTVFLIIVVINNVTILLT
jgi:uncharacterized membrane protein